MRLRLNPCNTAWSPFLKMLLRIVPRAMLTKWWIRLLALKEARFLVEALPKPQKR